VVSLEKRSGVYKNLIRALLSLRLKKLLLRKPPRLVCMRLRLKLFYFVKTATASFEKVKGWFK
jgi:hypothetical protein